MFLVPYNFIIKRRTRCHSLRCDWARSSAEVSLYLKTVTIAGVRRIVFFLNLPGRDLEIETGDVIVVIGVKVVILDFCFT